MVRLSCVVFTALLVVISCKPASESSGDSTNSPDKIVLNEPDVSMPPRLPVRLPARLVPVQTAALVRSMKLTLATPPKGMVKTSITLTGLNIPLPSVRELPRRRPNQHRGPNPHVPGYPHQPPVVRHNPTQPQQVNPNQPQVNPNQPQVNPNQPAPTPFPIARFVSRDGTLRFNYPAGWTPGYENQVISIYKNPGNRAEGMIQVMRRPQQHGIALESWFNQIIAQLRQSLPDLIITSRRGSGTDLILFLATYSSGGVQFKALGIVFFRKNLAWFAHYSSEPGRFNKHAGYDLLKPVLLSL